MRGRHGYGAGGLSLLSLARTLTKVSVRGGVKANGRKCKLCKKCEIICPANAIRASRIARTWELDKRRCISCYRCIQTKIKKEIEFHNSSKKEDC